MFMDEPATLEQMFRAASHARRPATKEWTDAYLAAFAEFAGFRLVTFDRGLHQRAHDGILLTVTQLLPSLKVLAAALHAVTTENGVSFFFLDLSERIPAAGGKRNGFARSDHQNFSGPRDFTDFRQAQPAKSFRQTRRIFLSHRKQQLIIIAAMQRQSPRIQRTPSASSREGNRHTTSAPTPLAAHRRGKSVESPSERSIIAVA